MDESLDCLISFIKISMTLMTKLALEWAGNYQVRTELGLSVKVPCRARAFNNKGSDIICLQLELERA